MKWEILILFSITYLILSCNNNQAELELEKYKSIAEIEQQNLEIVRKWIEEVNVNNFEDLYKELFSKDFKHYVPSNALPKSFEEYKEIGQHIYPAFHNLTHTIEDIVTKDDKVVVRMTAKAIHGGDFYDIPATGNKLEWSAIAIFEISEGKIIKRWEEVNLLDLFKQMGMELQME